MPFGGEGLCWVLPEQAADIGEKGVGRAADPGAEAVDRMLLL